MTIAANAVSVDDDLPRGPLLAALADAYRELMSCFPTGVTVVTALDLAGNPHGMTCTSVSSVTLSPPTLLVCLSHGSGTLAAIRASGSFAVNLLHLRGRRAAGVFSSATADRFGQVRWEPSPAVGAPWLAEHAFALAECQVDRMLTAGDHEVILGVVVRIRQLADTPLLYGMRRFSAWPPDGAPAVAVT